MLSYQHSYHAGNLADVHKHALLATALDYLTQKDKPLSYIETHAGRGLYDLTAPEAVKTGEAAQGISKTHQWFAPDHPYSRARQAVHDRHGAQAYPGSPLIAQALLRPTDSLHLAELHPAEFAALKSNAWARNTKTYRQDGLALAQSLCPPTPRRGLMLIDPSYEIKSDYSDLPRQIAQVHRKWNVGVIALWYPILTDGLHIKMLKMLENDHPEALRSEVRFPPARDGHRMVGSGMFILNPPWGLGDAAAKLVKQFKKL
ncbi:23S rRNA (adenine(2030)-N(6))-methyltransferase RlmJ [Thalassococcus lentus]|uniref:Ribosomal RNA large subunit methyltransferase J n=1 Tax=Thalassococcus lentus TaxID=1210524 RepID=A0ABT4XTR0_9RHOB|nr:23S rRNA (adenine(2030)-N(6))-methyltransferase RlmJ [Thalassococcus lentus]MDA7425363.1 23S rRNA (adenine(2030)-N(6))-methyltransferase RlmJ [Thalassococcus lentus]